jgi:hypothetical protein
MSEEQSPGAEALAEVAMLLGGSTSGSTSGSIMGLGPDLTVEDLKKRTLRQLVDSGKRLGLTGISRLNKDALAARVWQSLKSAGALEPAPAHTPARSSNGSAAAVSSELAPAGAEGEEPDHSLLSHKFETGEQQAAAPAVPVVESREIPWGYGRDRMTAMAVDPDRLFAYWEVLDESIERARAQLGAGGADAWLSLRVYDTSGRIFDGTNAHSYFDHRLERGDRQWFFRIGKPTSETFVEIGLKSAEGYFVKIARSGRVEFPRREPAPWSEPEWLTVRVATGHVERAGTRTPPRAPGSAASGPAPRFDAAPTWALRRVPWEDGVRFGAAGGEQLLEWEEVLSDGSFEGHRSLSWEGPVTLTSWEAGPFTYPVEVPEPVREAFVGKTRVFRLGGRTHIVYGPWQVVIRGLGAHQGRSVLARWEVYRSWISSAGHEVRGGVTGGAAAAPGRGGASERLALGASELRLGGASETLFAGASQWLMRGSSERQFLGASELRMRGSSEQLLRGASENQFFGASERRLGASERRLGASENAPQAAGARPTPPSSSSSSPPPDSGPTAPSAYPEVPREPPRGR